MEKDGGKKTLSGTIYSVVYENPENGYSVIEIDTGDTIYTAAGNIPYAVEGEQATLYGAWVQHPEYGRQFAVENCEKHLPTAKREIQKYLASGAIKGIGPVIAARIVAQFGESTFQVMENHPEWLADIPGISKQKAALIKEDFASKAGMRTVMVFCGAYFGPTTSLKIYKKWGYGAPDIIRRNPYVLASDIQGVSFLKADEVAKSLGVATDSDIRVRAALLYTLKQAAAKDGHTCMPEAELLRASQGITECDRERLKQALDILLREGELKSAEIEKERYIYLKEFYQWELGVAAKLHRLDAACSRINLSDVQSLINMTEAEDGVSFARLQRVAITEALNSGVAVITGGPGTGKTTVVKALIRIFNSMGIKCALAAPTGRAAKRLSEATASEAKTVHRLLEMDYREGEEAQFLRDENNPIEQGAVIVDEASMLDLPLTYSLLRAIRPGSRLILIGDINQLPCVGAGSVLKDIIESARFCTVHLTEVFRQAQQSLIIRNAHTMLKGEMPVLDSVSEDFFFLPREGESETAETVLQLCAERLPKRYDIKAIDGIQVLCASKKGGAGTQALNALLQAALNPPKRGLPEISSRGIVFRSGDKVMQTRNNYELKWEKDGGEGKGVFNGDIGIITLVNTSGEYLEISFDERRARYDFSLLEDLELAYAVTVHKSQGSEYPITVIPVCSYAPMLLTRNVLYTAITRARDMAVLVGSRDIVRRMVENDSERKRWSGLKDRIVRLDE